MTEGGEGCLGGAGQSEVERADQLVEGDGQALAAAYGGLDLTSGGFPLGGLTGQLPSGMPSGYPSLGMGGMGACGGFGAASYGQYGGYGGYSGYGQYAGMYPNMYQMFAGYGMFPQGSGFFPQGSLGSFPGMTGQTSQSDGLDGRDRLGAVHPGANLANMMPGDWLCPRCGDHVFARNRACRRCATPKPEGAGDVGGCCSFADRGLRPPGGAGGSNQRPLPGDWHCPKCNDLQFARNKQCRMCGTGKPEGAGMDLLDERPRRGRSRSRSHSRRR